MHARVVYLGWEKVSCLEMSSVQGCPYREVPLYNIRTYKCSLTLCWTRPYSRPGSSQKLKSCLCHSGLNDGAVADPKRSSRNI